MNNGDKKAVLLLAFGGAGSLDEVEPFIANVLKGRKVTPEMVEKARERYKMIGGSSPLLDITKAQAGALEELLRKEGMETKVYVGMRYWRPYIKDTLEDMVDDGVSDALAIIMAPHSSRASTGGYVSTVEEAVNELEGAIKVDFSETWHTHPLFIDSVVDNLKDALGVHEDRERTLVIFSAHSLPEPALRGDPYIDKIRQTIEKVIEKIDIKWRLAYQSRGSGPVQWLGPSVEEVIKEAKEDGMKGITVVPLGFVSDHVETLYDIDILFKETAQGLGLKFSRSSSLNTKDKFIAMLADIVKNQMKT